MKGFRCVHLAALCGALILLGTVKNGRDAATSAGQQAVKAELPLTPPHKGIEGVLVDAFSYLPYEREAELDDTPNATLQINFIGSWPAAPQAALQYAASIWGNILSSPVPIIVNASFSDLEGNTLAQAGPVLYANFSAAPIANTWFAAAVADRLTGSNVGSFPYDITATFDSDAPWYFGLDAHPPSGQYDFVSVALHELGHGLGFVGSGDVVGGLGYWGLGQQGYPVIYDRYARASGTPIISFAKGSAALAAALTGNNLFFASPVTDGARAGISAPAKLYAPATFNDGSSFSHLDELAFPAGNANALMTPRISSAEANHNPGPVTAEIFTDIGWGTIGGGAAPGQPTVTGAVAAGGNLTVSWNFGSGGAPTSHLLVFYSGATPVANVPSGAGNTANIPLPPGVVGTFGVRVTAINSAGSSPPSALFTFTIGGGVPGQPTVTSAVASGGVLNVAWTLGSGASPTSHRLDFYSAGTPVAQVTVGAAINAAIPIPPGVTGTFGVRVTAFNGAIAGPTSAEFTFTIGPACTLPTAPIVSGGVVGGTASVSWQPVAGATSYIVSAGTSQGGTQYLAPTNVGGTLGVSASGLPSGFVAWVRVIAVNACNQQGPATDFLVQ